MKHSLRTLSIVVALGLLVAVFGLSVAAPAEAAAVTVAEDDVEWTAANGDSISSVRPDITANIYIRDGALQTTKSGTAVFTGFASDSKFFDIANGAAGAASPGTTTGVTLTLTAVGYSTTSPSTTPLTGFPTASEAGVGGVFVSGSNLSAGTFTLLTPVSTTTTATFGYHVVDSWDGQSTTLRRAKITSTSDPAGEWITISEVAAVGSTSANATSTVFHGTISLSSDAAKQGTNNDGVWVQDGDTLTASYTDSAGVAIDTDTVTVDGVKPTISNIVPADGTITNVINPTVTFDVTDTGSGISTTDFGTDLVLAINNVTTTNVSFQSIADGFRGIFAGATSWLTPNPFGVTDSTEFSLRIVATDQAGNSTVVSGTSANITIDTTKPTMLSAKTGTANTAITVTFSETTTAVVAADFTVAGATVSAAVVDATNGHEVDLTVSALAPDAKPVVTVSTVSDEAGNVITAASTITATDGVKVTVSPVTISKALAIAADAVKVTAASDEKLAVDGLIISVNGAATEGKLTVTSPTPNNFEGTMTVASTDTTGIYGASIQGTDLGNNVTTNLTTVTDETSTVGAASVTTITLGNGPIGDTNFDGVVNGSDITITDDGVTATTTAVNASTRVITVSSAIAAASVVKVTYTYVAADTFEIDQSAPTVTFDPDGTVDVQNQSPFIRLTFDEDEYPGDSYKTVTLTKAELTKPDATTVDLLSSFLTADNIKFIYGATDLALGAYTLKVSATDTAGNKLTDASVAFTIAKRTVTLSIQPGWNLISLPDSPAADATAINTVIASDKIDIVLTYDPTVPGSWLRATRQADGTLGGEGALVLTDITANRAYWIHSTDIVSLVVDVPGIAAGAASLPPSFKLVAGWNLIPVASSNLATTTRDADDYFTGLDWSRAYGYSNSTNAFVGLLPSTADTVSIGNGYWVFLNKAGTLVP